jgi:cyclophilin family peptidyl-prolyl cis-trans isomerase
MALGNGGFGTAAAVLVFHSFFTEAYAMAANRSAEVKAAQKDLDFKKNAYQLELDTSLGKITLDMDTKNAPGHCLNMLGLAKIGYYDGLIFHRIIKGFMIQGGCPQGTGTGGPGYTINAEFNATPHVPGVLSMARTADPNSAGSQFFLCLERVPHLDNKYTAFGKTADDESLAVVRAIGTTPTGAEDRPKTPVTINKATVIAKPLS